MCFLVRSVAFITIYKPSFSQVYLPNFTIMFGADRTFERSVSIVITLVLRGEERVKQHLKDLFIFRLKDYFC